jgi:hypothetical protein
MEGHMPEHYSVFAKFRKKRLTLMRRIPHLSNAIEFAERIRQLKFHDRHAVFIVHEGTGEIVDERESVELDPGETEPGADTRRSSRSVGERARHSLTLTLAERALNQGVSWVRQAQRELPSLGLDDAIAGLERASAEIAQARASLERPGGPPSVKGVASG